MLEWLIANNEWIFSGIGVFVLTIITTVFVRSKNKNQKQKVGDGSTAIQVGGDLKVGDTDGKK